MEKYPDNWVRINLIINPETKEIHCIGGDQEEGEGDQPYTGLEILKKMFCKCDIKKKSEEIETTDNPSDVGC